MSDTQANDRQAAREGMVRTIVERHESPAEWPIALRRIAEAAGFRPEKVDLTGSLEDACHAIATAAARGANPDGLRGLFAAIAAYGEGRNTRSTLFELEAAALAYAKRASAGELLGQAAERLARAASAHAKAVVR